MFTILDSPLGGAFYTLLALLLVSTISVWLHSRARGGLPRPQASGLGLLMLLRLVQLPVYILAWLGSPLAQAASAPLERGVLLFSLAVIVGLWAQPQANTRRRAVIFALPAVGAFIFALLMLLYWLGVPAGSTFNYTDADYAWSAVAGLIAVLGLGQIATSPSPKRTLGLVHILVLLLSQVVHILLAEPFGNLPLAVMAAHLLSLPLLFGLPAFLPPAAEPAQPAAEADEVADPAAGEQAPEAEFESELALQGDDPDFAAAEEEEDFFQLGPELPSIEEMEQQEQAAPSTPAFVLDEPDSQDQPSIPLGPAEELARQLAQELGADVCVLATHNEAQLQLEFEYGYNVLRSAAVEPARISLRQVPRLAAALQRGRILRLEVDAADNELAALSQALRLSFPANLLMAPFEYPQDLRPWAVLALHIVTPWEATDEVVLQQQAETLGEQLAEALGVSGRSTPATQLVAPIAHELKETRTELEALQQENARYRADVERLLAHIDALQGAPTAAAGAVPNGSQELLAALQQENQRLKQSLTDLQAAPPAAGVGAVLTPAQISAEQAKEELRLVLEEVAALHAKLQAAQQAIVETAEQQPGAKIPAEQVELVASIAQELRQPLSSVMGYTDLLLGESVGLLGALQRKFLERVRSSTERMNTLIDNLIRIAELDPQGQSVQRSLVDLSGVIDDAISLLREPLQEKRIALRVNLPRQMPSLNTDKDALQQILYHLLQNADAASPAGGAIALRAAVEEQPDLGQYVLIQVTDSGGGIPEDALPRVFSRVYRAQNPVIPGVGDSGVGLTIAETLTKALGGRIWVESQAGVGATFSVVLPLAAGSSIPN